MISNFRSELNDLISEDLLTSGRLDRTAHENEAIDRVQADISLRGIAAQRPILLFFGTIISNTIGFAILCYRLPRKLFLFIPSLTLLSSP